MNRCTVKSPRSREKAEQPWSPFPFLLPLPASDPSPKRRFAFCPPCLDAPNA